MKRDHKDLIKGLVSNDRVCLSKLINQIESNSSYIFKVINSVKKIPNKVYTLGITGPPGAGKSTLTNQIIKKFRGMDLNELKSLLKTPILIDAKNIFSIEKLKLLKFNYDNVGRNFS